MPLTTPQSNKFLVEQSYQSLTYQNLPTKESKARMDRNRLQHQVTSMRRSLFDQGYLEEQFIQLEELQDDANPYFVQEIVTLFYNDSARFIQNIEQALSSKPIDFSKLDDYMHQFKGSSSSIGAKKVTNECSVFREYCSAENAEGCISTFQQVKQEYAILRRKLEAYFQVSHFDLFYYLYPYGETGCSYSHSMRCPVREEPTKPYTYLQLDPSKREFEYEDGNEEDLMLSNEKLKFHVSHDKMERLNLSFGVINTNDDGYNYDEMVALVVSLDDCQELEPGDIMC
ncbi:hypothetical protein CRYUN_Cryun03dG0036100 [Craigia yunnanensis]